jgi:hypothetical protein
MFYTYVLKSEKRGRCCVGSCAEMDRRLARGKNAITRPAEAETNWINWPE